MADTPTDAVEIKCTLSDTSLDSAMTSLHLGDPDRKREIWFFDSIDSTQQRPRLFHAGIILRLRRKKDGPGESTLKLRPARAELLIGDFRAGAGHFGERYSVEWDWANDKVLAASMDAVVDREAADEMVHEPTADRFSVDQLRLLHEAGTPPPHPFADIRAVGPIASKRWDDVGLVFGLDVHGDAPRLPGLVEDPHVQMGCRHLVFALVPVDTSTEGSIEDRHHVHPSSGSRVTRRGSGRPAGP